MIYGTGRWHCELSGKTHILREISELMRFQSITLLLLIFIARPCQSWAQECNNWLSLPATPSYAEAGEIDIVGDKITIEAKFNRTTAYTGGQLWAGDLVSKHKDPVDANYLLRPNTAEITTTSGYFRTPDVCEIELNKTYHVAMVYDGVSLKFYRNGYLLSEVAASGDLIQNDWKTRIGYYEAAIYQENFVGFVDEVRIWNVSRSQDDIKKFMDVSLPNPTSQTGLVAYYTFENTVNKQGNASYNLSLSPLATINSTNNNCTFVQDSCDIILNVPDSVITTSDTIVCYNEKLTIYTTPGFLYKWTPNDFIQEESSSSIVVNPLNDIVYYVEALHIASNTVLKDSIRIKVSKPEINVSGDTSICKGQAVQLQAVSPYPVSWIPFSTLSNPNASNPIAFPQNSTRYVATVIDDHGCSASDSLLLEIKNRREFQLNGDSVICSGMMATITAGDAHLYTWTSSSEFSNINNASITTAPGSDAVYSVHLEDTVCFRDTTLQWKVTVKNVANLSVPNAFTPNDDGKNDCFGVSKTQGGVIKQFDVFNRWGQLVFKGDESSVCWDGNFNGIKQPPGIYVYIIRAITPCGEVVRRDYVTLIR